MPDRGGNGGRGTGLKFSGNRGGFPSGPGRDSSYDPTKKTDRLLPVNNRRSKPRGSNHTPSIKRDARVVNPLDGVLPKTHDLCKHERNVTSLNQLLEAVDQNFAQISKLNSDLYSLAIGEQPGDDQSVNNNTMSRDSAQPTDGEPSTSMSTAPGAHVDYAAKPSVTPTEFSMSTLRMELDR